MTAVASTTSPGRSPARGVAHSRNTMAGRTPRREPRARSLDRWASMERKPGKHRQVGHRDGDDDGPARLRRKGGGETTSNRLASRHDVDGAHDQGVDPAAEAPRGAGPLRRKRRGWRDTDIQRLPTIKRESGSRPRSRRPRGSPAGPGMGLDWADLVEEVADGRVAGDPRATRASGQGRGDDKADEKTDCSAAREPLATRTPRARRRPVGFADRFASASIWPAARGLAAGALAESRSWPPHRSARVGR